MTSELSQNELFLLLLRSFALGATMSAVYDLFSLRRRLWNPKVRAAAIVTAFEDLSFFTASGILLTLVFFAFNSGRVRIMGIVGYWCGVVLWHITLGKLLVHLLERVFRIILSILRFVVVRPIKAAATFAVSLIDRTVRHFRLAARKRYTKRVLDAAVSDAGRAFGTKNRNKI